MTYDFGTLKNNLEKKGYKVAAFDNKEFERNVVYGIGKNGEELISLFEINSIIEEKDNN